MGNNRQRLFPRALCVLFACFGLAEEPPRAPVLFTGSALPEPPQQHAEWLPPQTSLPEPFVSATAKLFEQGLADPRDCEYREVEVQPVLVDNLPLDWNGARVVKLHGWVMPLRKGETQRFGVCWNGLVYPLVSVGAKADLRADIIAVLEDEESRDRSGGKDWVSFPFPYNPYASVAFLSQEQACPLHTCFWLRLGEGELTRRAWGEWDTIQQLHVSNRGDPMPDPYFSLASGWLTARFDRAVAAHALGDDQLALLEVRAVAKLAPAVVAEAKRRKIKDPEELITRRHGAQPYLISLRQLPALLADQERRAREKPVQPAPATAQKAQRIASLIARLEEVAVRETNAPGSISGNMRPLGHLFLSWDPIVWSLIEEGDDAVEPLLECMEKDSRLTRAVEPRDGEIVTVARAAQVALRAILETDLPGKTPQEFAANARAYWRKAKGTTKPDRWFTQLADDKASASRWVEAAEKIVEPQKQEQNDVWTVFSPLKPGEVVKVRGEILRSKAKPSVTQLMTKRIEALTRSRKSGSEQLSDLKYACYLALALRFWDANAALPHLQALMRQHVELTLHPSEKPEYADSLFDEHARRVPLASSVSFADLLEWVVYLYDARQECGDHNALDEYAEWLKKLKPELVTHHLVWIFRPIWENPDHPVVVGTAEPLFANLDSPWAAAIGKREFGRVLEELADTPLLGLSSFRKIPLAGLADKAIAGQMEWDDTSSLWRVRLVNGAGWEEQPWPRPADPTPAAGVTKWSLRVCDLYAHRLSLIEAMPLFHLYWPEAKRDAAIAEFVSRLTQFGEQFKYSELQRSLSVFYPSSPRAILTLPLLDHPATAEEVRKGQAIFSLEGEGEVRVVRLPAFSMPATWLSQPKESPSLSVSREHGSTLRDENWQQCHVWQAEEVLKDGQWQRFYGVVGQHWIAKVPAAEIELAHEPSR